MKLNGEMTFTCARSPDSYAAFDALCRAVKLRADYDFSRVYGNGKACSFRAWLEEHHDITDASADDEFDSRQWHVESGTLFYHYGAAQENHTKLLWALNNLLFGHCEASITEYYVVSGGKQLMSVKAMLVTESGVVRIHNKSPSYGLQGETHRELSMICRNLHAQVTSVEVKRKAELHK